MITEAIKKSIDNSVLCWLATSGIEYPNVSPKEIFNYHNDKIIIANIASPKTSRNIRFNANVCVSFIDILIQKGWQVFGIASEISSEDQLFSTYKEILENMTKGKFPFNTVFEISPTKVKEIIAPGYMFYPEKTTEKSQIASAKKIYKLE